MAKTGKPKEVKPACRVCGVALGQRDDVGDLMGPCLHVCEWPLQGAGAACAARLCCTHARLAIYPRPDGSRASAIVCPVHRLLVKQGIYQ
jgi:hypothetical protein